MDEVVKEVFKKDFDKAEAAGEERGREQMIEEMLKDNVSAKKDFQMVRNVPGENCGDCRKNRRQFFSAVSEGIEHP